MPETRNNLQKIITRNCGNSINMKLLIKLRKPYQKNTTGKLAFYTFYWSMSLFHLLLSPAFQFPLDLTDENNLWSVLSDFIDDYINSTNFFQIKFSLRIQVLFYFIFLVKH